MDSIHSFIEEMRRRANYDAVPVGDAVFHRFDPRDVKIVDQTAIGFCKHDEDDQEDPRMFVMFNGVIYISSIENFERFHKELGEVLADKNSSKFFDPPNPDEVVGQCFLCGNDATKANSFVTTTGLTMHIQCDDDARKGI